MLLLELRLPGSDAVTQKLTWQTLQSAVSSRTKRNMLLASVSNKRFIAIINPSKGSKKRYELKYLPSSLSLLEMDDFQARRATGPVFSPSLSTSAQIITMC